MDWIQLFTIIIANLGMFLWTRSESREDWRHMDAKTDAIRQEINAIHQEIKDFHGRLCAIEENRKK